jgi:predicted  nucleic acid-binding Zn-ribbon protein
MSEIMQAVLRMPDNLFWADDPISRYQHNQVRLEAAERIRELEEELEIAKDTRVMVDEALRERRVQVETQQQRIALLEAAIRKHRKDVWSYPTNEPSFYEDHELYAVLQEDKPQ